MTFLWLLDNNSPTFGNHLEPNHQRVLKLRHKFNTPFDYRQPRTREQFIQSHLPKSGFRFEPVRVNVRQRALRRGVLVDIRVRWAGHFARKPQTPSEPFGEGRFARTHHANQDQNPSRLEAFRQVLSKLLERFSRGDGRHVHASSVPFTSDFRFSHELISLP